MSHADKALYQAKQRGRNQTVIYTNGQANNKDHNKIDETLSIIERRKYPRIQTLIKIKGEINHKAKFSGNTFDISYAGLSLLLTKPLEINRRMNISLYLPDIGKKDEVTKQINVEGLTVWCKQINDYAGKHERNRQRSGAHYLAGVQFNNLSRKDSAYLQKYFVSIFKKVN